MIAIIAGTGNLPAVACNALCEAQKQFFVISLFPEDNFTQIRAATPEKFPVIAQTFYKAQAIVDLLKQHNTTHALFIGKVDKQHLLTHIKLDWLALKLLASLATKNDTAIMDLVGLELEKQGIALLTQRDVLKNLLVEPGILTGSISSELEKDINFGISVAIQMSSCDIGQTVIVKDGMVLAVEAIEGTDACIKRGIELGGHNVVVCKAAKTNQSLKFDLPTIGAHSLRTIERGQIRAIAWQSAQTFVADKESFVSRAQELGITLVSK